MQRYTWLRYADRSSPNASRCRSSTASTIGCAVTTSTAPSLEGGSGGQIVPSGRLLVPAVALGPLVAAPGPHGGDRGLQTAATSGRRIGAGETRLQRGEHRLAAGIGVGVGGGAQVLVRQGQLGDCTPG